MRVPGPACVHECRGRKQVKHAAGPGRRMHSLREGDAVEVRTEKKLSGRRTVEEGDWTSRGTRRAYKLYKWRCHFRFPLIKKNFPMPDRGHGRPAPSCRFERPGLFDHP
jgi:hypothetical protein